MRDFQDEEVFLFVNFSAQPLRVFLFAVRTDRPSWFHFLKIACAMCIAIPEN
jgi:hypothetical protein